MIAFAKALCGELVPQDPNDEHASELFISIQAECEKLASGKPKSKTSKHTTSPQNQESRKC